MLKKQVQSHFERKNNSKVYLINSLLVTIFGYFNNVTYVVDYYKTTNKNLLKM